MIFTPKMCPLCDMQLISYWEPHFFSKCMGTFSGFKPSVLSNFLKISSAVSRSEAGCGKIKQKSYRLYTLSSATVQTVFQFSSVITDCKVETSNSTHSVQLYTPPSASFLCTDELDWKFSVRNLRKTALSDFLSPEPPLPSHWDSSKHTQLFQDSDSCQGSHSTCSTNTRTLL